MSDELRAAHMMISITRCQCMIAMSYARIEGMKAANQHRAATIGGVDYAEDAFQNECNDLAGTLQALQEL